MLSAIHTWGEKNGRWKCICTFLTSIWRVREFSSAPQALWRLSVHNDYSELPERERGCNLWATSDAANSREGMEGSPLAQTFPPISSTTPSASRRSSQRRRLMCETISRCNFNKYILQNIAWQLKGVWLKWESSNINSVSNTWHFRVDKTKINKNNTMIDKYSANQIGYQIINEWYSMIVVFSGEKITSTFWAKQNPLWRQNLALWGDVSLKVVVWPTSWPKGLVNGLMVNPGQGVLC